MLLPQSMHTCVLCILTTAYDGYIPGTETPCSMLAQHQEFNFMLVCTR